MEVAAGFRDHHQYSTADLERVARAVQDTGAAGVLTTDKDAVRLRSLRPLPVSIAAVPLEVSIGPDVAGTPDHEFAAWLLESVRAIRTRLTAQSRQAGPQPLAGAPR
jgi:hypothetical protein